MDRFDKWDSMTQDTLVVISKYNEEVKWVEDIKHPYIIYDKSNNPVKSSIHRPNIGREAETLLYYIITNYYSLPKKTIFLQGDPRSNPIIYTYDEVVDEINREHKDELKTILTWEGYIDINKYWLKTCSILNSILFGGDSRVKYSSGVQYVIPKDVILNRPIDLYITLHMLIVKFGHKNLIGNLDNLEEGIDPWTLEPIWGSIFDKKIILKNDYGAQLYPLLQNNS